MQLELTPDTIPLASVSRMVALGFSEAKAYKVDLGDGSRLEIIHYRLHRTYNIGIKAFDFGVLERPVTDEEVGEIFDLLNWQWRHWEEIQKADGSRHFKQRGKLKL